MKRSKMEMKLDKYQGAVQIVRKLKEKGHETYFVGGWVRDKLLDEMIYNTPDGLPKNIEDWRAIDFTNIPRETRDEVWEKYIAERNERDIDIATSCPIQEVPKIFSDCIYVGMAFGVCIVKVKTAIEEEIEVETLACGSNSLGKPFSRFTKEKKKRKKYVYYSFDVATFRWDGIYSDGRRPDEIKVKAVSVKEDASRRDFTINALYYDPVGICFCLTAPKNVRYDHECSLLKTKDRVLDFVGGQKDLEKGIIRAIGNPRERMREDKLRMIRAVRLRYQLNGKLFPNLFSLIHRDENRWTFRLEEKTERAIKYLSKELLPAVSYERIWQELEKMSKSPWFHEGLQELRSLSLLSKFFPETKNWGHLEVKRAIEAVEALPQNTPTLIKIMAFLGTFDKDKVFEITQRFNIKKPNWYDSK